MSTATQHTPVKPLIAKNIPDPIPNGNITSFVASKSGYFFFKRSFDIFFSLIIILGLISWLLPLIALIIRLGSKGSVFFVQKRIGKNGHPFRCLKFRTMVQNDDADEKQACENDERITFTGKFLRISNLDELPQFINVLKGDMSIVGPRPHMISDCTRFSFIIPSYSSRTLVRPGITGWAQVNGHHGPATSYESVTERYYWDARYITEANTWLDIKIIVKTVWRILKNSGNHLLKKAGVSI